MPVSIISTNVLGVYSTCAVSALWLRSYFDWWTRNLTRIAPLLTCCPPHRFTLIAFEELAKFLRATFLLIRETRLQGLAPTFWTEPTLQTWITGNQRYIYSGHGHQTLWSLPSCCRTQWLSSRYLRYKRSTSTELVVMLMTMICNWLACFCGRDRGSMPRGSERCELATVEQLP